METGYTNRAEIGPREIIGPHGHVWQPMGRDPSGAYQFCKSCYARRHMPVATGVPPLRGDWLNGSDWNREADLQLAEAEQPGPEPEPDEDEDDEDPDDDQPEQEASTGPRRRNIRQPRRPRVVRAHTKT